MAIRALDKVRRFVVVGGGFSCVLLGSRELRWMIPGTVLGDVVVLCWLYLAANPSLVGVDVDGLDFPLHCPMTCSHQMRGQSFFSGAAMSHRVTVGSDALPGGGVRH
jgi:hypothetical protein